MKLASYLTILNTGFARSPWAIYPILFPRQMSRRGKLIFRAETATSIFLRIDLHKGLSLARRSYTIIL